MKEGKKNTLVWFFFSKIGSRFSWFFFSFLWLAYVHDLSTSVFPKIILVYSISDKEVKFIIIVIKLYLLIRRRVEN